MTPTQGLFEFSGKTFDALWDGERLKGQLERVARVMADGLWRTLEEIECATLVRFGKVDSQASISARLRDLRNKFGCTIDRRRRTKGLHEYRWDQS